MADNLPGEIFAQEILIRLPMKSVVRCRCVCKLWNSLSYNPDFVSLFDQNPNRELDDDDYVICMNNYLYKRDSDSRYNGLSILSRNNFSETRMDIDNVVPFPLLDRYIHLIGSVNGLVCMAFYSYECASRQFIIWNPTIRFLKKIVVPKRLCLNFPPGSFLYGFGWDSMTNDYKLIIAKSASIVSSAAAAAAYSCKTDCWSNSMTHSIIFDDEYCNKPAPSVIVNGSPYWRIQRYFYNNHRDIVKFDVRNNEFTYLNVPSNIHLYRLINLDDCLALIQFEHKYATAVYRFDEEGSIWTKIYAIDKSVNIVLKSLCFKYGGEIVFGRKKVLYDPKSHTIKQRRHRRGSCAYCLVKLRNKVKWRGCGGYLVNGFSYTPSLVALPGMKALHSRQSC